ncbi:homeobox protein 12-like [Hydractinia symbiolongicarpus]|uniref:homeobox protein 12-like n=1 Tax=Hydractinia symbiolongicarpus TaxID=13093 RepID=UPI00254C2B6B|nr:homeobox protein 12-like [Hydractinia symbiolongicarpus]
MDSLFRNSDMFKYRSGFDNFFQGNVFPSTRRRRYQPNRRTFSAKDLPINGFFDMDEEFRQPQQRCHCGNCNGMKEYKNNLINQPRDFLVTDQEFISGDDVSNNKDFNENENTKILNKSDDYNRDNSDANETNEITLEGKTNEEEEENKDLEIKKTEDLSADSDKENNNNIDSNIHYNEQRTDVNEVNAHEKVLKNTEIEDINKKLHHIEEIKTKVKELEAKVDDFVDNVRNKNYLFCEEMLMKCLLELDNILANGEEKIRSARKAVVMKINENIKKLEGKLSQNTIT